MMLSRKVGIEHMPTYKMVEAFLDRSSCVSSTRHHE